MRCASYVPEYAGGASSFGIDALATGADTIVELLDYPLDAKRALLEEIAGVIPAGCLLLSSGLGMTADEIVLAANGHGTVAAVGLLEVLERPSTVEIAVPAAGSPDTLARAVEFWRRLRHKAVPVPDAAGMISPRIVACIINEAAWALGENIASREDVDLAMELGAAHAVGPLRRADRIGLHRVTAVLHNLQDYYGEERYRPAPLLRRLVLQGRLGVDYGRGFYEYEDGGNGQP